MGNKCCSAEMEESGDIDPNMGIKKPQMLGPGMSKKRHTESDASLA